jgi:serine protease inhibitor
MCVNEIVQKTFIGVYEEGTEAAAVTAVKILQSAPRPKKESYKMIATGYSDSY